MVVLNASVVVPLKVVVEMVKFCVVSEVMFCRCTQTALISMCVLSRFHVFFYVFELKTKLRPNER